MRGFSIFVKLIYDKSTMNIFKDSLIDELKNVDTTFI